MTVLTESVGIIAAIVLVSFALFVVVFRAMWRVAEPNQALVVSGRRHRNAPDGPEALGFRVVTGGGNFVIPGVQVVRLDEALGSRCRRSVLAG